MTAEGVFPKIDGDILYPSEVNRFSRGGYFIGGAGNLTFSSGVEFPKAGSFYVSGGIFRGATRIEVFAHTDTGSNTLGVILSGTTANFEVGNGQIDNTLAGNFSAHRYQAIINCGSNITTSWAATYWARGGGIVWDNPNGGLIGTGGQLDTSLPFVVFYGGWTSGTSNLVSVTVKGECSPY